MAGAHLAERVRLAWGGELGELEFIRMPRVFVRAKVVEGYYESIV